MLIVHRVVTGVFVTKVARTAGKAAKKSVFVCVIPMATTKNTSTGHTQAETRRLTMCGCRTPANTEGVSGGGREQQVAVRRAENTR